MVDSSFTEFKLDYPEIKSHGFGDAVSKCIFSGSGHYSWRIECYYWEDDQGGGDLNLRFSLESKFNIFNGFFEVFLLRGDGAPSSCGAKRSWLRINEDDKGKYVTWSDALFLEQDQESSYVKNGVITLICGVIALPGNYISVPASNIVDHFVSLMGCSHGSDVSFSVAGETFRAHRVVLAARSPVFKAELLGSMAEATMPCIILHDIQPDTFKAMLEFIYTDRLYVEWDPKTFSPKPQQFHNLLAAADRYDLGRLKLMCAQELWNKVSVDTVATTLGLAEMYNCPELKDRCLDFFLTGKNFIKVVVTEGYLWLMQRFPSVIDEIKPRLKDLICY